MAGEALVQRLAAHSSIKAIALTGHASEQRRREALAAGFREFLAKPAALQEIRSAIERLLQTESASRLDIAGHCPSNGTLETIGRGAQQLGCQSRISPLSEVARSPE